VFLAVVFGSLFWFWELWSPCGNFWLYLFGFDIVFLELFPAIRSNLLRRTPAQKDFHCTRAKRTGEAIGARASAALASEIRRVKLS